MNAQRLCWLAALLATVAVAGQACGIRSTSPSPDPESSGPRGAGTGASLDDELSAWLEPSPLQAELAGMTPASALPPSDEQRRLVAAIERHFRQHASHRTYVAVDKPLYRPGETIWFRAFELSTPDLTGERDGHGVTAELLSPQG
jgi:alpha-2-macroglobulin-like protein